MEKLTDIQQKILRVMTAEPMLPGLIPIRANLLKKPTQSYILLEKRGYITFGDEGYALTSKGVEWKEQNPVKI